MRKDCKIHPGDKFYFLTARCRSSNKSTSGNYYWWFDCECGGEIETLPTNVRRKKHGTKSCGCLQKKRCHGKSWLTQKILYYKRHAEKLGVDYHLTRKQFEDLVNKPCTYCGSPGPGGVDRQNPLKGYTLKNSVPCCSTCNYMKRTMTVEEFVEQCQKVVALCSVSAVS